MADAALVAIFEELLKAVMDAKGKAAMFKNVLERMQVTLASINPIVQEIEELKEELNGKEEIAPLMERIKQGQKLVLDCSNISWWNCCKKSRCTDELNNLETSLTSFFQIVMQAQQTRDIIKTKMMVEDMHKEMKAKDNHREKEEVNDTRRGTEEVTDTHRGTDEGKDIRRGIEEVKVTGRGIKEEKDIGRGIDEAKDIHKEMEERKDIHKGKEEAKDIHRGKEEVMKDIGRGIDKVKNTGRKIEEEKDIHKGIEEMKDIHKRIEEKKDIHKGKEEAKDIHRRIEELKDTRRGTDEVKNTRGGMEGVKANFRENHGKVNLSENSGFISSCAVPEPPVLTVGLDVPFQDLKTKLLKDGVSVIVLSAPGGYGKTTLAKKLCHDQQVEGKFKNNIFFITVSKTPNLKVIVQKLLQHKGYHVPEFQSNEEAINHLEQFLKRIGQFPILMVLDDVWSGSEFLLEKFMFQLPDYKILVTSRSTFPRFGSTCSLKTLNDEDSMILFRRSAFRQDRSSYIPDEDLLKKVVKVCKGLPLALIVVGRSLCGQPAAVWMKWSGGSIFDSERELLDCLGSSLDALDSKLKECYLDLGSFPENQMIPATALIDMWVELCDLDEAGVSAIANLHELSNRNLIDLIVTKKDDSEVDGYYNDHFVMQHDILRELVNHQTNSVPIDSRKRLIVDISENKFPKWWMEQKQQPISAFLLSISTDEMFSSKWYKNNIQLPEVEVLVLNFRTKNYTLPEFTKQMYKLKVLIVTNYGFFPAEVSNFPLLGSLSSLKRIRLEKVSIPSFGVASVQLQNLQKISLVMCSIGQNFTHCKISDALPNLVEINIDYCNDLDELFVPLCDIVHLKKLSITYCHKLYALPKEIGQLVNLEVLRIISCVNMLEFPAKIGSLFKLSILDISDCSRIMKLPEQIGELHNLSKLFMKGCSSCKLPPSVVNLKLLKNVICDEETATLWKSFKSNSHLRNLTIKGA